MFINIYRANGSYKQEKLVLDVVSLSSTPRQECNKHYVGKSRRNFEARGNVHNFHIAKPSKALSPACSWRLSWTRVGSYLWRLRRKQSGRLIATMTSSLIVRNQLAASFVQKIASL